MNQKILIVEDEEAIARLLDIGLRKAGYLCEYVLDGMTAADKIENNTYDLILLDIMLPEVNGYELMEYIRPEGVPVIFLTAKGSTSDKVKGLHMGAEDYIVKPFEMEEVVARIEVVLRRFHGVTETIQMGDVVLQDESRQVTRDGELISLTPKEYQLLHVLMHNPNRVLTREYLFEHVWECEYTGDSRTLDLHIQRLRKKLDWKDVIRSMYGTGYLLQPDMKGESH